MSAACDRHSLLLLDEAGMGTDPEEGAALAAATLRALADKAGLILATTHHSSLKALKYESPTFENAAVQFDEATLAPTCAAAAPRAAQTLRRSSRAHCAGGGHLPKWGAAAAAAAARLRRRRRAWRTLSERAGYAAHSRLLPSARATHPPACSLARPSAARPPCQVPMAVGRARPIARVGDCAPPRP